MSLYQWSFIRSVSINFTGRLAYIQLRISPVASCYFWQVSHDNQVLYVYVSSKRE